MLDIASLTPHGFCLAWDPGLIWLHALSDIVIAGAYFTIPFAPLQFARQRQDLAFPWVFRLFAVFILACGTTHLLAVVTLIGPFYWLDGFFKAVTAIVSAIVAVLLRPLLPRALSIPSQAQLQSLNQRLRQDVAERRAAEARIHAIYARSPAPLCATDMGGVIVEASDQWLDMLGDRLPDVIGRNFTTFHADQPPAEDRDLAARLQPGQVAEFEELLLHRDGTTRIVQTSATMEIDAQNGPALIVSAMVDITGRRQTEAALRESEAHLRQAQKMEAVGHLTGGIAHDFNNMLTAITCVMELLEKRLPEDDGSRRLVGSVLDVSNRAARLTSQLLAFSRRQRLVAEPIDPIEVVHEMLPLLTRPLGENVQMDIIPPPQPHWRCLADRNQLEAALLNLVLNARAAIRDKGRITIETRAIPTDQLASILEQTPGEEPLLPRDYLAITVADDGEGMSDELRRRAFEPFFTTKPVGQGTGLGLSQTYGFARQSGGTVRIESQPGQGTRVTIILPRTRADAVTDTPSGPSAHNGTGETILLVEDEDTVRDVVEAALRANGFRVIAAGSGDEALHRVEQGEPFDILFTDVVMPGRLNGVDLALALRARQPGLPVLFATGYSDRTVLERWPDHPIPLLAKPYSIHVVADAIHAARMSTCPDSVPT